MATGPLGYVPTMAKPQQAELRRSGKVPALDPDATETRLTGEERPSTGSGTDQIPEEQRPGHHPETEQDKPDLDRFAARLGIVSDEEVPPEAPRVEEDSPVTRLQPAKARTSGTTSTTTEPKGSGTTSTKTEPKGDSSVPRLREERLTFSPIGLLLVGPVTGIHVARKVLKVLSRLRG